MADQYPRDDYERRKAALKLERSSFIPHYRELTQFIQPRRGRFFIQDRDRGGDRYNSIINSKATVAHRVARSGLLSGAMSPSSPWFNLTLDDDDLADNLQVKVWLSQVERIIYRICSGSNLYSQAPALFGEMLLFGTGSMAHVDDFEDVARFYTLTAGAYMIGQDHRQVVNTIIREWEMTVAQIVGKFGIENVSEPVKTAYGDGHYDRWYPVTHIVQPNDDFQPGKALSKFKKFRSVYYEHGCADKSKVLSDKGYDEFPFYVPRWDTTGEDIYGTDCPAMTALGDIKGLQIEERRKAQAIDKMVNPPLHGPAGVRNVPIDSLPGGLTIYDANGAQELKPVYTVNPQLQELRLDMKAVEDRIDNAFFVHLFRAISDMPGIQPKNQLELQQRDQERLLELGPVLEHLHGEFLAPLVNRIFNQCLKAVAPGRPFGLLPPPPPQMSGKEIKVTFVSSLARAQRSAAAATLERTSTFIAGLASSGFQQALDKLNVDEIIDEYASVTGTSPKVLVSTDDANAARAQRAAVAQKQQQAEMADKMASAAQKGAGAAQALGTTPGGGGQTVLANVAQAVQQRAQPNLFGQR